jgi:GTP-binding protein HflX
MWVRQWVEAYLYKEKNNKTEIFEERAVLVGLITPDQKEERAKEYLEELAFLAETAGAVPEKFFLQKVDYPNPKTFVGPGKLSEIKAYIDEHEVGLVIFYGVFTKAEHTGNALILNTLS